MELIATVPLLSTRLLLLVWVSRKWWWGAHRQSWWVHSGDMRDVWLVCVCRETLVAVERVTFDRSFPAVAASLPGSRIKASRTVAGANLIREKKKTRIPAGEDLFSEKSGRGRACPCPPPNSPPPVRGQKTTVLTRRKKERKKEPETICFGRRMKIKNYVHPEVIRDTSPCSHAMSSMLPGFAPPNPLQRVNPSEPIHNPLTWLCSPCPPPHSPLRC